MVSFLYKFCILEFLIESEYFFFRDFYLLESWNIREESLDDSEVGECREERQEPSYESIPESTRLP